MDYRILFDKNNRVITDDGKRAFSTILYVPIAHVAVLSMYGMLGTAKVVQGGNRIFLQSNDCVTVHKISFDRTSPLLRKLSCGESINIDTELRSLLLSRKMRYEPVTQCNGVWQINPCSNLSVITIPGFYMLELFDADQFDNVYIEYLTVSVSDSLAMPDGVKMGSK